jgi:hypothetical protein
MLKLFAFELAGRVPQAKRNSRFGNSRLGTVVWEQPFVNSRLGTAVWEQPFGKSRLGTAVWEQPFEHRYGCKFDFFQRL